MRTRRRMRALPSKRRLESFSSSLSSSRAARRILESVRAMRQISRLLRRPYSPASWGKVGQRQVGRTVPKDSAYLELGIETGGLERAAGDGVRLAVVPGGAGHDGR